MAKYGGGDVASILVDGYNLIGGVTDIPDIDIESMMEESHTLGDVWAESLGTGVRKAMFSQNGFYDDAANEVNVVMADHEMTERVVSLTYTSSRFVGMKGAFGAKYSRKLDRNKLHKANIKYTVTGNVDEGLILQALATKTADWDTEAASVDAGASSSVGGAAYLHVTAFSGFTGFVAKIRHSADNVTFADLATFSNVTTAGVAERITVATGTTINRYLAMSGDVTGSGSITVQIGFARYQ